MSSRYHKREREGKASAKKTRNDDGRIKVQISLRSEDGACRTKTYPFTCDKSYGAICTEVQKLIPLKDR